MDSIVSRPPLSLTAFLVLMFARTIVGIMLSKGSNRAEMTFRRKAGRWWRW